MIGSGDYCEYCVVEFQYIICFIFAMLYRRLREQPIIELFHTIEITGLALGTPFDITIQMDNYRAARYFG